MSPKPSPQLLLENDSSFWSDGASFQVNIAANKRLLERAITKDRILTLGRAEGESLKDVLTRIVGDLVARIGESNIHNWHTVSVFGLFPKRLFPKLAKEKEKEFDGSVISTATLDYHEIKPPAWFRKATKSLKLKKGGCTIKAGKVAFEFYIGPW